jgi:sarcosine oxidase delta subunit
MNILYTTKKNKTSEKDGRIRLVRGDETEKEKWARCVREAKLLTIKRDQAKIRICELCFEACDGDIKWGGGGHWSGFENQMTVSKFATDIGMHPKTLMEWLAVKRYIYDNLNKKYQTDVKWSILSKIRRNLDMKRDCIPSKIKITKLYEDILEEKTGTRASLNIQKYLDTIKYNVDNLESLSDQDRQGIQEVCKYVLRKITEV